MRFHSKRRPLVKSHKDVFWNLICAMYFSRIWKWQCQSLLMVQCYLGKYRQLQAEKNCKQKCLRILTVWAKNGRWNLGYFNVK